MAVKFDGLDELRAALKQLPAQLVSEATPIVHAHASAAAAQITAAYPYRTGALQGGVSVTLRNDAVSASARVVSRAKHANIFEKGTGPRRWRNGKNTGRMPAGNVFIPRAIDNRRAMNDDLIAFVERLGFDVTP
jgi:hypothetical protein